MVWMGGSMKGAVLIGGAIGTRNADPQMSQMTQMYPRMTGEGAGPTLRAAVRRAGCLRLTHTPPPWDGSTQFHLRVFPARRRGIASNQGSGSRVQGESGGSRREAMAERTQG